MLKNKFKLFTVFITIALIFTTSFVFADEENTADLTVTSEDSATTENGTTTPETQTAAQQNIKKSDVYLTGDDVNIDYIIDGNLFVVANNVTISSEIGGDAFILAKTVTIAEQGYVFSNLFVAADTVNVKGIVYDVYAATNSLTVSGYVYRDVKATCMNTFSVLGTIGRNAYVSNCSNIAFTDSTDTENASMQGTITGNLEYTANSELTIPSEQVGGEVKFNQMTLFSTEGQSQNVILTYLLKLGASLCLLIVVWLLGLWLAPKFIKSTDKLLKEKPAPVFGFGVLGLVAIPVVTLILLVLNITALAAVALILVYITLLLISSAIFEIAITNILANKFKIDKTVGKLGVLILTGIVIWAICLIPFLGAIISILMGIFGLGILINYILPKKNEKVEK